MASSVAYGRARTTAAEAKESPKMAWSLSFTKYFFDIEHSCYDQFTPVKARYHVIILRARV